MFQTMKIYYQLAMTYGNQNKFMLALLALQEAIALEPEDVEIKYQIT